MISKLPAWPKQPRQPVLQPLVEQGHQPAPITAPHTWPAPPTTAMKRYSMPWLQPEGRRIHQPLHVGIQPAGGAGVQRGDHEDHDARADVSTPIASAITTPPFSARIARPRGNRAGCGGDHRRQHEGPDQVIDLAALVEAEATDGDRRQARDAALGAQEVQRAEQENTG